MVACQPQYELFMLTYSWICMGTTDVSIQGPKPAEHTATLLTFIYHAIFIFIEGMYSLGTNTIIKKSCINKQKFNQHLSLDLDF